MASDHGSDWELALDNIKRIPAGYWTCYREVARSIGRPGRQGLTVAMGLMPLPFPDHYHRVRNVSGIYNDLASDNVKSLADDRLRAEGCPVDARASRLVTNADVGCRTVAAR